MSSQPILYVSIFMPERFLSFGWVNLVIYKEDSRNNYMGLNAKKKITDSLVKEAGKNREALDRLLRLSLPRVFRLVEIALGGTGYTDDVVQEVLLKTAAGFESYRGPDRFGSWLDRITINEIKLHFRKNRRWFSEFAFWENSELENIIPQASDSNPETMNSNKETYYKWVQLFKKLKPVYRTTLALSLIEGYTAAEIAEIEGCSSDAAWKRVQRGVKILQKEISRDSDFLYELKGMIHE